MMARQSTIHVMEQDKRTYIIAGFGLAVAIGIAIVFAAVQAAQHAADKLYPLQCAYVIVGAVSIGLVIWRFKLYKRVKDTGKKKLPFSVIEFCDHLERVPDLEVSNGRALIKQVIGWTVTPVASLAVNVVFNLIGLYFGQANVTKQEVYFFYLAIAVSESTLHNIVVTYLVIFALERLNLMLARVAGIACSAVSFVAIHYWDPVQLLFHGKVVLGVYAGDPWMLVALGVLAVLWSSMMLWTKQPLIPIFSHVFMNAIVNLSLVLLSSTIVGVLA